MEEVVVSYEPRSRSLTVRVELHPELVGAGYVGRRSLSAVASNVVTVGSILVHIHIVTVAVLTLLSQQTISVSLSSSASGTVITSTLNMGKLRETRLPALAATVHVHSTPGG